MKIFFDFDDVLFDTREFKKDYFEVFKRNGVSQKIFDQCYYEPLKSNGQLHYNPIGHIRRVCKEIGIGTTLLEKSIKHFLKNVPQYVFSDVRQVLTAFEKRELILLSFSRTDFQKTKIYDSEIAGLFGKVEITDDLKGEVISEMIEKGEIFSRQKIFFVDDRAEQIENVKKLCPEVVTILCDRKEGRYHDRKNKFCDHVIRNLGELEEIIYA